MCVCVLCLSDFATTTKIPINVHHPKLIPKKNFQSDFVIIFARKKILKTHKTIWTTFGSIWNAILCFEIAFLYLETPFELETHPTGNVNLRRNKRKTKQRISKNKHKTGQIYSINIWKEETLHVLRSLFFKTNWPKKIENKIFYAVFIFKQAAQIHHRRMS